MNRLLISGLLLLISTLFSACTTNEVAVGGVPGWLADGAVLEYEPAPVRPDPAILPFELESGAVAFTMNTEKRYYTPPSKSKAKKAAPAKPADPIERGRDARIKRLFR